MMMMILTMTMILTLVAMRLALTMKWMWMTIICMLMMTMILLFLIFISYFSFLNLFVEQVSQVLILGQHVKIISLFQTIVLTCLKKTIGLKNCVLIGLIFEILQLSWYGLGTQFW